MRWAGRHGAKDRLRERIWRALEESGEAVGSPWSRIPDFRGSETAAERLATLPCWSAATVVKVNPDRGQGWVRLRALRDGKCVYTPVPELVEDHPFLLLDPAVLRERGVGFEAVMYSEGAAAHGQPVAFDEMRPMDVCVVGSVAVSAAGGRTGKGGGFADLEMGIFRELGTLPPTTPVVTTVSERQLVDDGELPIEAHDTPLDWIVTPERAIATTGAYARPERLDWSAIRPDQFDDIPFLRELRRQLEDGDR